MLEKGRGGSKSGDEERRKEKAPNFWIRLKEK